MDEARKSSRCGNSNSCVYVKPRKSPDGTAVLIAVGETPSECEYTTAPVFTRDEWDAFTAGVKAGEFDWDVITKTTGSTSTQDGYVDPAESKAGTPLPTDMPSANQPEPTADEILREIDALRSEIERINDEPVGHLAAAVRVEREKGGEPAVLDLVRLTDLLLDLNASVSGLRAVVREHEEMQVRKDRLYGALDKRLTSLEMSRADQRTKYAALAGVSYDDSETSGCSDPDCLCG